MKQSSENPEPECIYPELAVVLSAMISNPCYEGFDNESTFYYPSKTMCGLITQWLRNAPRNIIPMFIQMVYNKENADLIGRTRLEMKDWIDGWQIV